MRPIRTLALAGAASALLITSLGMPAAAADGGTLLLVNGRAGGKVDICLNGKEVRSRTPYAGRKILNDVRPGKKTLKFYRADPRRCRGKLIAKRTFTLEPFGDWTIVLTKRNPKKVVFFENTNLGQPALDQSAVSRRHAADIGDVTFRVWQFGSTPSPTPAFVPAQSDPVWSKGQGKQTTPVWSPNLVYYTKVTRRDSRKALTRPVALELEPNRRQEKILIGDRLKNLRLIVITRKIRESLG